MMIRKDPRGFRNDGMSNFEFRQIDCLITCEDKTLKTYTSSQDISSNRSRGRNEFVLLVIAGKR